MIIFSLLNWLLLIITVVLANAYFSIGSWQAGFFGIITGGWLLKNLLDEGIRDCFFFGEASKEKAKKTSSTRKTKPMQLIPYPMEGNYENSAIGAVDKCCEFAAYCIGSVIPMEICKPEPFSYNMRVIKNEISYGISWTTNYYSLDSAIKEHGYYLGKGFFFSENNGLVTYIGHISNDAKAVSYLMESPINTLKNEFEKIAWGNFTGLTGHHAICNVFERPEGREISMTIY